MASRKKTAQALKRPDQFVDFWTRVGHQAQAAWRAQKRPLAAGLTALVVVTVGGIAMSHFQEEKATADTRAVARIENMANAELSTDTPAPGAASAVPEGTPRFKTEAERRDAVVQALDGFLAGRDKTAVGAAALVMKARYLVDAKPDDALAAYDKALGGKLSPSLRFLALEGRGYALESKGDLDQAVASYVQLADDPATAGAFKDRSLFDQARVAAKKGDKATAAKLYHQILDGAPDTSMREEVNDRLAMVEAK